MPDTDFYLPLDGVASAGEWSPSPEQAHLLSRLQLQAREKALILLRHEYGSAPEYYGLPQLLDQQKDLAAIHSCSLHAAANLAAVSFYRNRTRPLQVPASDNIRRRQYQDFLQQQQLRLLQEFLAEFYRCQLITLLPSRWIPEARLAKRLTRMLNSRPDVISCQVELELVTTALAGDDWLARRNRHSLAILQGEIQQDQPTAVVLLERNSLPVMPQLAVVTGYRHDTGGVAVRLAGFQWPQYQCEYLISPDGRSCNPLVAGGNTIPLAGLYPIPAVPLHPPVERVFDRWMRKTGLSRWFWHLRPIPRA